MSALDLNRLNTTIRRCAATGLERALANTKDARRNTTLAARIQHYAAQASQESRADDEGSAA